MNHLKKRLFVIYRPFSTTLKSFSEKTCKREKSNKSLQSVVNFQKLPEETKINGETIDLLERLSLVDCATKQGIETLEASIHFADQILQVNVSGIEPLITHLEDFPLLVRADELTDGNCKKEVLKNASITEDGYFVTPPGNIIIEIQGNFLQE